MKRNSTLRILFLFAFILVGLMLTSCGAQEEIVETPTPTPTLPPDQHQAWEDWESSDHADTYDLEKGPNTYCAKCHSPQNWDYSAEIDSPPNCVSCKLPSEAEPRMAVSNQLVPEEEWMNIGCEVCHQMNGRIAEPGYYWYDSSTGYYEVVQSTTELCEKCHQNSGDYLVHQRDMGTEVHEGFSCTDCHNPHDPYAACSDCHLDVVMAETLPAQQHIGLNDMAQCLGCHTAGMNNHSMETQRTGTKDCLVCHDMFANLTEDDIAPVQHSSVHDKVDCIACHDGSGLEVGFDESTGEFVAFRTLTLPFGELADAYPTHEDYQSHNLTSNVQCTKCHFADNPWGIPETPGLTPEE